MRGKRLALLGVVAWAGAATGWAQELVGVTGPAREADLAFAEPGIIGEILVEEGQRVEAGQVLASLDNRVLAVRLEIARLRAGSLARLQAAQAELEMRSRRLTQMERLASRGSANEDELAKTRADFAAAEAAVQMAKEERETLQLEARETEAGIEQRTLRSPFAGVVTRLFRDVGENVAQGNPPVLNLVQLDPLEIIVHVEPDTARRLRVGQKLQARAAEAPEGAAVEAEVSFISPVADASSGTTRVRLRLPNGEGRHRSGMKYRVKLDGAW